MQFKRRGSFASCLSLWEMQYNQLHIGEVGPWSVYKECRKEIAKQVLLFDAECNRDSLEFVEAVGRLLFAHPAVNPADLAKEEDRETKNYSFCGIM